MGDAAAEQSRARCNLFPSCSVSRISEEQTIILSSGAPQQLQHTNSAEAKKETILLGPNKGRTQQPCPLATGFLESFTQDGEWRYYSQKLTILYDHKERFLQPLEIMSS
eukprot:4475762-Amphidinium_carterae.1